MLKSATVALLIAAEVLQAAARPASNEAEIRRLITALSDAEKHADRARLVSLLEPEAEIWDACGPTGVARLAEPQMPMSETTAPMTEITRVRSLTPDIAVVHAVRSQYGSLIGKRSAPVIIIVRKSGARWRIISYALLGSFGPPGPAPKVRLAEPR